MLEKNELERHILSRCFDDTERIDELLETRYTMTGTQKPSLVLLPTGTEDSKSKSLLHSETKPDETLKQRKKNTRIEIRLYLDKVKKNQGKVVRFIQQYNRKSAKETKPKPFPLVKMLEKYQIPQYKHFEGINSLWEQYIQSLVFPENGPKLSNKQTILSKLASAEYNGCFLSVLESRNHQLLGLKGIVVFDTQYSFVVCVPRKEDPNASPAEQVGGFRFIPKKHTLFSFDIAVPGEEEALSFTLIGSRIDVRAVDRSTKKFKNHNVEDIL